MKNATMLVFAAGIAVGTIASATDGDVDPGFGVGGVGLSGITDAGGGPLGCKPIVQADGKILVCGTRVLNGSSGSDLLVARFNADGSPDSSFSFDGLVTVDFDNGAGSDLGNGIALQADGKIVVVGTAQPTADPVTANFAVARLNSDGTLDSTFGAGTGKTTIEFDLNAGSGFDTANGVVIQSDGKIVVVGSANTATGSEVAVARLLPDGTRDSGFNLTGKVTFGFALPGATAEGDTANGVAIDSQGRIVLGATASEFSPDFQSVFAAARLTPSGQLDANFHSNGRTTVAFDPGTGVSSVTCTSLVIQRNNGSIVLAGAANSSASATQNLDIAVVRLLPDGSPDGSFGIGGKTLIAYDLEPSGQDLAVGITQQSDGRLLLVGTSLGTPIQYGTATRLIHDGSLDPAFGAFGKKAYNFALTTPEGQAFIGAAFQGTQIIVSGIAYVPPGGGTDFIDNFVVRLANDTIFANGLE